MRRTDLILKLRPLLLARRDRLCRSLRSELSLQCHDEDDLYEDEIFSQLALSESCELEAIDEALQRMREGSYGVCEECGRNISLARLEALPYATSCIQCQRQSEWSFARRPVFAAR